MLARFPVGSLVRCRQREWIVLPSEQEQVLLLRPLGGSEAESCGIYLPLEGHLVEPASFDPPTVDAIGDLVSGQLLRDAARLSLRNGAGPFRSLGKLAVRPRPYQLVPLIMALRLEPVRLLIADDVGIGKTIEAGLIVRELLDRGEIRRLTVLCPPHLCDQWQRELSTRFAIDAAVVRSSTIAALERAIPEQQRNATSVWEYYPWTITSIDYAKSEHNRASFIQHCPELVIVDEAHTAAQPGGARSTQQQRYELLRAIITPERHALLLTATPHSGIEEAFLSLLGLLDPRFEHFDLSQLQAADRDALAPHLIQRRRADVKQWLGETTPFPERAWSEVTYRVADSAEYQRLFEAVFEFARELVQAPAAEERAYRTRVRYWAALALLRCVMSSPAAAEKALQTRARNVAEAVDLNVDAELFGDYVHDRTQHEAAQDVEPAAMVEEASDQGERGRLRQFAARAQALRGAGDPKLHALIEVLKSLLKDGFNPIIYCRYIATANYVAEQLQQALAAPKHLRIIAVTGERSEEEREALVEELAASSRRVLVATDCLSEGINLQGSFDAVLHYDLPWNPNRLEQREGRVDRYGQTAPEVRTVLLFGEDNPIDQAVMKVLLRKARSIHRTLGIAVPLPLNSESLLETVIQSLFHSSKQLSLFEYASVADLPVVQTQEQQVELEWNQAVEREKQSRTRFAQRSIKPAEVAQELEETDVVLGDQQTVRSFVLETCQRLDVPIVPLPAGEDGWELAVNRLPPAVVEQLQVALRQRTVGAVMHLTFAGLPQPGREVVGRNHPLTMILAQYVLETALLPADHGLRPAARSGVIRTPAVPQRTMVLLLRVRMLIERASNPVPLLAEELVVCGFTGTARNPVWLEQSNALDLLSTQHQLLPLSSDERQASCATGTRYSSKTCT